MTFDYGKSNVATEDFVNTSIATSATTLRTERATALGDLGFERQLGPKEGYTFADSPVTSLAAKLGRYFFVAESIIVDGVTVPANTVIEYIATSDNAGVATNWHIDDFKTKQLRGQIQTITGEIGLVTPDNVISAQERLDDVTVPLSFTGIANGTEGVVTVTDADGNVLSFTVYINSNTSAIVITPTWLNGRKGPLIIRLNVTHSGVTISKSAVITLENVVLEVDEITGDDVISIEELSNPIDITGSAEPNASIVISGDITIAEFFADEEGNWISPNVQPQLAALGDGTHDYTVTSGDVSVNNTVEVAGTVVAAVTSLTHDPINPASPSTQRVKISHTGEAPMTVTLRGLKSVNEVEQFSISAQNNSGTVTNIDIPSAQIAKLTSPSKYEVVLTYQGNDSAPYKEAVTYEVVNDPVTNDPLPTEAWTISLEKRGQNNHRKNTGYASMVNNDGTKQYYVYYDEDRKWRVGVHDFPDGANRSEVNVHNLITLADGGAEDNHNTGSIGVASDGTVVFVADMHADEAQGGLTDPGGDIGTFSQLDVDDFPNNTADRVTYPQMFKYQGELHLIMRESDAGGGTPEWPVYIWRFNVNTRKFDLPSTVPLNAGVKLRFYVSNVAVSPDGNKLGVLGVFRDDEPGQGNGTQRQYDLVYLENDTADLLPGSWKTLNGSQSIPVTLNVNGLGSGQTSYLVPDSIYDTPPDPKPAKAGTLAYDANNVPHIFTELVGNGTRYITPNGAGTDWVKSTVPFDEGTSQMVYYGGKVGLIVHDNNDVRFHPMDSNDPDYENGVTLLSGYVQGAYVLKLDIEAMRRGYISFLAFKNLSNGRGDTGNYKTDMFIRVVPFTLVGVENTDTPDVSLQVDQIGTVTVERAQEPIYITGSAEQAGTITFSGPFSIDPIVLHEPGPYQSQDISSQIVDPEDDAIDGDIDVTLTTPDGSTTVTTSYAYDGFILPFSLRTNVIGSSVGDVVKILDTLTVSTSQLNTQMTPVDERHGYVYTANIEHGPNGDTDDTSLRTILRKGIQLSDQSWQWESVLIEDRTVNDPYHSAPSVMVDDDGLVHTAYNMHNTPWQYKRSADEHDISQMTFLGQPITQEEIDRWKFQNQTSFPTLGYGDIPGNMVTYPRYQRNRAGVLYVAYRQAAKPNRPHADRMYSTGVARYDTVTKTWTPLGVQIAVTDPDDYVTDSRAPNAPTIIAGEDGWTASTPRMMFGPNGELHIVGYWIQGTASGTLVRPWHIMTTDDTNFTDIEGNAVTLPITSNVGSAGLGFANTVEFETIGDCAMDSVGNPYIVHSPKVGSREILTYNTGTDSWDSEASPNAAFEIFFDDADNLYALATGLTVLKRLSGSSTWTTVYSDSETNRYPRATVNEDGSIAYIHTHSDDEQSITLYALRLS